MRSVIAILRRFVASTILVSIGLLIFNFILLGTLVFKEMNQSQSPEGVLKKVATKLDKTGNGYVLEDSGSNLLRENDAWAMLLDGNGDVIWDSGLPGEIPRSYTLTDIAKFSRYYLLDYPVYTWEKDEGLLVMGYPKWSYGKYQFQFLYDWGRSLPLRLMVLLLLNVAVALLISIVIGMRMMRGIRPLVEGVHGLARDEEVKLDDAKGLFGDLAGSINSASSMLQSRTAALKMRDEARSNWIAGISHDIRTPLSMVLGYSSELEENASLPEEQREQAAIIRRQGEKLRSLVSDLNLVSMLEYEMQPLHLKPLRLAALSRQAVAELLNNRLDEGYQIDLDLKEVAVQINGDEKLLSRAIGNLLQNSVRHNPEGCRITVETFRSEDRSRYAVRIRDNGKGIPEEQLADVTELPYSSKRKKPVSNGHGLGLPMVAKIAQAHHGQLLLERSAAEGGLSATLLFPVFDQQSIDKTGSERPDRPVF